MKCRYATDLWVCFLNLKLCEPLSLICLNFSRFYSQRKVNRRDNKKIN